MSSGYVPTYVRGLDDLLGGGIPEGNVVLVTGTPGARKTSLVYHIMHHNARDGRRGLFIALEQGWRDLQAGMRTLGLEDLSEKDLYVMDTVALRGELEDLEIEKDWPAIMRYFIQESVESDRRELIAIDSLDVLYALGSLTNPRRELFHFFNFLRELDQTALVIAEIPVGSRQLSRYGEDFLADGVFLLRHFDVGETGVQLRLRCVKMRRTRHEEGYYALDRDVNGFYVTNVISRQGEHLVRR
ncbi:MAG: ATPase domain-containing protein [Thermoplasmata archaeon]|nr:ATPase domain-containing protein [Thermoplasmata archaeon]